MAQRRKLEWVVTGDAKSAQSMWKTQEKGVNNLSTAAKRLGTTVASGFAFDRILSFGKALVGAANESQKVAAQTEAVLKSMGGQANVTADDVAHLADSISKKTGIDDEAIQSSENLLLTFGKVRNEVGQGNDIFDRATQVTADLSVALGKDLNSSALMVGKALNDPIAGLTALNRAGVQFTAQQKAQIRTMVESGNVLGAQKVILEELEAQVGGSAEAQATATDKMAVAWENVQEEMGAKLLPIVNAASDAFTGLLEGPAGGLAAGIGAVGVSVGLVAAAAGTVIGPIRTARDALAGMGATGEKANAMLGRLGRGLAKGGVIVGGVMALKFALDELSDSVGHETNANVDKLTTSLERFDQTGRLTGEGARFLGEDFGELNDAWRELEKPGVAEQVNHVGNEIITLGGILNQSNTKVERAKEVFKDFDESLASIAASDPDRAFRLIEDAAEQLGIPVDELVQSKLPQYRDAVEAARVAAEEAGTPTDEFARDLEEVGDEAEETADLVQEYSDKLRATFDPLFGVMDAQDQVRDSQTKLREAQAALNEAVRVHGANSDEAKVAQEEYNDAQRDAQSAVVDLDAAAQELNLRIADGTVKVDDARRRFITMARQMGFTEAEAESMADQFGLTTQAARDLGNTDPNVRVTQTGAAPTRSLMNRVESAVRGIPGLKTVKISADGQSAILTANNVKRYIDGLTGTIRVVSYAVPGYQTFGGGQAEGGVAPRYMQDGGINWRWQSGPKGSDVIPAWLTPGEMTLNMDQQRNLFHAIASNRMGGGGTSITIDLRHAIVSDELQFETMVVKAIRRAGAKGTPITSRGRTLA